MRSAVVVGGARGLGAAIAEHLRRADWAVEVAGRATPPHDRMDLLVISAGPYRRNLWAPEEVALLMRENLDPVLTWAPPALEAMNARGWGRILTFGAVPAAELDPTPAVAAYMSAKAAVLAFSRALARRAGPGVTVNTLSPGFVRGTQGPVPPGAPLVEVEDVVAAAMSLIEGEAQGEERRVDGGWR